MNIPSSWESNLVGSNAPAAGTNLGAQSSIHDREISNREFSEHCPDSGSLHEYSVASLSILGTTRAFHVPNEADSAATNASQSLRN